MNVLITADIHIDDYADYNWEYRSRLKQFESLAVRLADIGKEYNCKEHWILGDIINRPNARSYIYHAAKKFLRTQSNNFDTVRYILGQHDCSSKSNDFNPEDTIISLFDFPNFIYMDHQVLEVDGHRFGFMNWRPEQSLEWMEGNVDCLFGHFTKSEMFGQEIDETRFKLYIHGDIHNSQEIGKFISVGNPIQHDLKSQSQGTALIFDTETCKFKRVFVDQKNELFLQIFYTSDRAKEGFTNDHLKYYVYRPKIITAQGSDKVTSMDWNDIHQLSDEICAESKVSDIHEEVKAKCLSIPEIDFNFQLNKLYIHGYRSIKDLTLTFAPGDKIALLGDNGSGKSSIIGALRQVFGKNAKLKYEQSFFTKDMIVTVTLTYQNKVYEITKGTDWRLVIEGQEQSYNNLTEFENDILVKLPFLEYLDLFFISSGISNLEQQFTSNRRIDLICRFFRLNQILSYRDTADNLLKEVKEQLDQIKFALNSEESKLKIYKDDQLVTLEKVTEGKTEETVRTELEELTRLIDLNAQMQLWKRDEESLITQLNKCQSDINKYKSESQIDVESSKKDLNDLKEQAVKINEAYETTFKQANQFDKDLNGLLESEKMGIALKSKLDSLLTGVCPECGSKLSSGKSKELIEDTNDKITQLRFEWNKYNTAVLNHPKGRESRSYYHKVLQELKQSFKDTNDGIEILSNRISTAESVHAKLSSELQRNKELSEKLENLQKTKPEEVRLPLEYKKLELDLSSLLNKFEEIRTVKSKIVSIQSEIKRILDESKTLGDRYDNLQKYIELMDLNGVVMENILRKLADEFSTPEVKYIVDAGVYRSKRYIEFKSFYRSKNKYVPYESCSDGQKTICDLDFLSKLFSINIGLLVLDEYLKHLDDKKFPKACDILNDMKVNTIILSTHDNNLSLYNKRFLLSLDDSGATECQVM